MLGAALAVEFADELVDGAKGATLPAIQHSLGIGYAQIGLLSAVPLLVGGLLELSAGLLRNRRAGIIGGGVLFVLSLAGVPVVLLLIAFAETPLSELTGVSPPARE